MSYFAMKDGRKIEIGSFDFEVNMSNDLFSVYTSLGFINSGDRWLDTCISDANSGKPVYHSSFSNDKEYIFKYGKVVTGYYYDKKTKKRTQVKESLDEGVFDNYAYPYFLGLLPLKTGYTIDLSVYDYKPENAANVHKTRIEEVKNNIYDSPLSGEHKVWQVTVFEEATKDTYKYYIDKDTRRIWKIDILAKGQQLMLLDKELDFNPYTTQFDKEATLKLIKSGTAVISGQVFARDNQNEGPLKGMAVLNINKKQFAKAGTNVILIPYTDFFKEWLKLNEISRKKGRAIPLPADAAACIKTTSVYDKEGHFEFVNLMPGDYLLYTEFGYTHTGIKTEVIGYTDTYINGMFQGSMANTESYGYSTNTSAAVKKIVTIKKDRDKETVKLKKTL